MKAATLFRLALGLFMIPFIFSCIVLTPPQAQAQDSDYLEPSEKYSREELAQMLAPIALYPDALLSQVLMASTYPIEVIEADRWVRMNPDLTDEALDAALLDKDWDPSVKASCHFPAILALMSERISETTNLGNAFLAQEDEVMDTVQELRARAYAQDNLTTNSKQNVIVERETIIIEPVDPRVIYVPYYDPFYVYGSWWYPAYPPYYWGPPGVSIGVGISYWPGFYFGFSFGTWSYFDWSDHRIHIDVHKRPRYVRNDRWIKTPGRWQHAPDHRRGVAYRDKFTARKYGQSPQRAIDFRRDTRGFPAGQDMNRDRRVDDRMRTDRVRPERERVEFGNTERQRIERAKPEQKRVEPVKQERTRVESVKQERTRVEPVIKQEQKRVEPVKQERIRVEPVKREPQQQKSRDNVFNRVEDGSRERISGERGRVSRQGKGDESSVRGGQGGADRDDRGRNRR